MVSTVIRKGKGHKDTCVVVGKGVSQDGGQRKAQKKRVHKDKVSDGVKMRKDSSCARCQR